MNGSDWHLFNKAYSTSLKDSAPLNIVAKLELYINEKNNKYM